MNHLIVNQKQINRLYTLNFVIIYIRIEILFKYFVKFYNVKNAETMFFHVSKHYIFDYEKKFSIAR